MKSGEDTNSSLWKKERSKNPKNKDSLNLSNNFDKNKSKGLNKFKKSDNLKSKATWVK